MGTQDCACPYLVHAHTRVHTHTHTHTHTQCPGGVHAGVSASSPGGDPASVCAHAHACLSRQQPPARHRGAAGGGKRAGESERRSTAHTRTHDVLAALSWAPAMQTAGRTGMSKCASMMGVVPVITYVGCDQLARTTTVLPHARHASSSNCLLYTSRRG